jgi:hypothetical protein
MQTSTTIALDQFRPVEKLLGAPLEVLGSTEAMATRLLQESREEAFNIQAAFSGAAETAGQACCALDSQVDLAFPVKALLIFAAQKFLGAVHHEQLPPKFSSNTYLSKGVLCPGKSIRSMRNCTVR